MAVSSSNGPIAPVQCVLDLTSTSALSVTRYLRATQLLSSGSTTIFQRMMRRFDWVNEPQMGATPNFSAKTNMTCMRKTSEAKQCEESSGMDRG